MYFVANCKDEVKWVLHKLPTGYSLWMTMR